MLYTLLNDAGNAFEPERTLMIHCFGLDGGGSNAAGKNGDVYVAWHGIGQFEAKIAGREGEARRRVWVTKSAGDGRTFSGEERAWTQETGACSCCGMKIFAAPNGDVFALYRPATESLHRDIYFLHSQDRGRTFAGKLLHKWNVNACPMSSMDFAANGQTLVCAWETSGQIYWTRIGAGTTGELTAAPGQGKVRKHPRLAVNQKGEALLVWAEGVGWQKGGSLAYQLYDSAGRPAAETELLPSIPTWESAAVPTPDNGFSSLY